MKTLFTRFYTATLVMLLSLLALPASAADTVALNVDSTEATSGTITCTVGGTISASVFSGPVPEVGERVYRNGVYVADLKRLTPTFSMDYFCPGDFTVYRPGGVTIGATYQLKTSLSPSSAVTQSGSWDIRNITGTVSLPTGAATAANQTSSATTLSTIATNTTGAALAANQTAVQRTVGSSKFVAAEQCTVAGSCSGAASYTVVVTGYTPYASATDLVCVNGSASKNVVVSTETVLMHSTSATLYPLSWIKRSTADSGGGATTPTPVPVDSSDSAATASVTYFTSAPSLGTTVGTYSMTDSPTATLTAVAAAPSFANNMLQSNTGTYMKPPVLHGTAEALCINAGGVSPPSGSGSTWSILVGWSEQAAP